MGHLFAMSPSYKVHDGKEALLSLSSIAAKLHQAYGSEAAGDVQKFGVSEDILSALPFNQGSYKLTNRILSKTMKNIINGMGRWLSFTSIAAVMICPKSAAVGGTETGFKMKGREDSENRMVAGG